MLKIPSHRKSGFTMIELIAVLVLIGVMSAIAVGFFSSTDYATEAGEAEQLRMDLRYAQQRAMGLTNDVTFNTSYHSYSLSDGMLFGSGENKVTMKSDLMGGSPLTFTAQTGLPDADQSYYIGESSVVTVNAATGLIQ